MEHTNLSKEDERERKQIERRLQIIKEKGLTVGSFVTWTPIKEDPKSNCEIISISEKGNITIKVPHPIFPNRHYSIGASPGTLELETED